MMWLSVAPPGATPGSIKTLYLRELPTMYLPAVGDLIGLWAVSRTDQSGPQWRVKRRYWDADGTCNLTMFDAYIDPVKTDANFEMPWFSVNGDLPHLLLAGGWRRWSG